MRPKLLRARETRSFATRIALCSRRTRSRSDGAAAPGRLPPPHRRSPAPAALPTGAPTTPAPAALPGDNTGAAAHRGHAPDRGASGTSSAARTRKPAQHVPYRNDLTSVLTGDREERLEGHVVPKSRERDPRVDPLGCRHRAELDTHGAALAHPLRPSLAASDRRQPRFHRRRIASPSAALRDNDPPRLEVHIGSGNRGGRGGGGGGSIRRRGQLGDRGRWPRSSSRTRDSAVRRAHRRRTVKPPSRRLPPRSLQHRRSPAADRAALALPVSPQPVPTRGRPTGPERVPTRRRAASGPGGRRSPPPGHSHADA